MAGAAEVPETAEPSEIATPAIVPPQPIADTAGQSGGDQPERDPVETALAEGLQRAAAAGQWTTVEALTRELQARREAQAGVVAISSARGRRGGR